MAKYCMLLVEVDYPKFFMLKISKMRLKKIKNRLAAAEMNAVEGGLLMAAYQFKSRCETSGLGESNSVKFAQLFYTTLCQLIKMIVVLSQHALGKHNRGLIGRIRTEQNCEEFRASKTFMTKFDQLFSWSIIGSPPVDGKTCVHWGLTLLKDRKIRCQSTKL